MNIAKPTCDLIITLSVLFLVTGCSFFSPTRISDSAATKAAAVDISKFQMDSTVGSYGKGREDNLILVTIDTDNHQKLISNDGKPLDSKGLPHRYSELMSLWKSQFNLTRVADWPVSPIGVNCLIFEAPKNSDISKIIADLNQHPQVNTAQPVNYFTVAQSDYNDPYLPLQYAVRSLKADYTHRWATGRGVTVAVIDTGVDIQNPEFEKRIKSFNNFVDADDILFRNDVHGTAVAGVIGAAANNNTGMVGIAPNVELMPYKACWQKNSRDQHAICNSITLLKALDKAIQDEVDVINLSLAGPIDPLLEQLVVAALERNIIVVGARSAENANQFPAAVPGIIAVTEQTNSERGVVKAPGSNVLSLHPKDGYKFYDGSSFSTAHVAGVAALIRELAPETSAAEINTLLKSTSDLNSGSTNACRAVAYMVKEDTELCDQ